jgi:hypothetical protein
MAISDFQLSIIALGAAGVAGVFAYNKWQERKYRQQTERAFRNDHPDVLLEPKAEPLASGAASESDDRIEPVVAPVAPPASEPVTEDAMPPSEPSVPLVHPAADCVLRLEAAEPIAANHIWQAASELLQGVTKPLRWLAWHDSRRVWQQIHAHSALNARQWRVALQLADRRGALTQPEIDAFLRGVQQLADRLMVVAEFPDRASVLARAQQLDAFCASVDVQIGIHIVANDPGGFVGTKLRGIAEATGMQLDDDGRFHTRDDAGHELFTLGNLEPALFAADAMAGLSTHGLTLNLDVPCVMSGGAAFGSMVTTARQLAAGLNGTVVDDNRQPLNQKSLEVIRAKIVEFQDLMSQHGIPAGTATALRLFS